MKVPGRICTTMLRVACVVALAVLASAAVEAAEWKPVTRAERTMAAPKIDPDADAEALLWEVQIRDEFSGNAPQTVEEQYLRIKIFTDRGREMHATVDIPNTGSSRISEVAARTIKADGRIIELNKRDIHTRTIAKASGLRLRGVSFALPNLDLGDIVEYRWRETYPDSLASYLRLPFSRDIPVHVVNYYVRPLSVDGLKMQAQSFNATFPPAEHQRNGSTLVSLSNVAADVDEEFAVPVYERKPWMFIYYTFTEPPVTAEQFRREFAKELHSEYARTVKVDDQVRIAARQAVSQALTENDKLYALLDLVRERVTRVDVDTATDAERRMAKENKHSGDTLKRGYGTGDDVTVLFTALARAAGFDAYVAAVPRRDDLFVGDRHRSSYFMPGRIVAIRTATGWRFIEPANRYSAVGALRWQHEWQRALIPQERTPVVVETPVSAPGQSVKRRVAMLRLLEDGTLEGDMTLTFTGHWGQFFKNQEDADAPADREKALKDLMAERLPGAEITNVAVENVTDPSQPYTCKWHMRMPGYAQRTGSRLFVAPAVFQHGLGPTFPETTRHSDIYFQFGWMEDDHVTIAVPEGFTLEAPERPAPMNASFGNYDVQIGLNNSGREMVFRRRLTVGQSNLLLLPRDQYPAVKSFFDHVDESDARALVLRQGTASR
jgi:Domain of Unknown Function with PDB structure (DUF3857)